MSNSIDTKKDEIRKNFDNMFESAKKKIKSIISVCPDWDVDDIDLGYRTLIVHLELKGSEKYRSVEIRYNVGKDLQESFSTNVACCGRVDLMEANDNLKYYTAVGDLLNHKDMLSLLKETLAFFTNKYIELDKEFDKLNSED